MALANYTLSFGSSLPPSPFVLNNHHQQREQYSDLLYSPEQQQPTYNAESYKNDPFTQPEPQQRQEKRPKLRKRTGQTYLPPPNQFTQYPRPENNPYSQQNIYQPPRLPLDVDNQRLDNLHDPYQGAYFQEPNGRHFDGFPGFPGPPPIIPPQPTATPSYFIKTTKHNSYEQPKSAMLRPQSNSNSFASNTPIKQQPSGFTKVEAGGSEGKTRLHAVLDYDGDEYDDGSQDLADINIVNQQVTPLQGPILLKNGTVPVVPLFPYQTVNNGSLFQIPILWTALSLALGYEVPGQVIKGVPCVKRNYQLFCPTAGNTYPLDKIEHFIDENKALVKRMYGSFSSKDRSTRGGVGRRKRAPGVPDPAPDEAFEGEPDPHLGDSYFRHIRQAGAPPLNSGNNGSKRIDACESKTEIITPYWALNSARKLRAIVNTMHFEQAIHQEVCSKTTTARCTSDCGCEQKYKWHRLLAYDPDEDCAGIFMDWFLFPSCCVCRCNP